MKVDEYFENIKNFSANPLLGRRSLAKALSLLESHNFEDYKLAKDLIERALEHKQKTQKNSKRIAISGVPGVGKSTFIEKMGIRFIEKGARVAVLAIDPSSSINAGSLMADKTRMVNLSVSPNAFVRPSPSGDSLGGVAALTRESIFLCELAGFDTIFLETLGVGQAETAAFDMSDFFILLSMPGTGDSLQAIKKGILELANLIVIHKFDGEKKIVAREAERELQEASLTRNNKTLLQRKIIKASSIEGQGLDEIESNIQEYFANPTIQKEIQEKRTAQNKSWFYHLLKRELIRRFYSQSNIQNDLLDREKKIIQSELNVYQAVDTILNKYF